MTSHYNRISGERLILNVVVNCKCGYSRKLSNEEMVVNNNSPIRRLDPILVCPQCKTEYDEVLLGQQSKKNKILDKTLAFALIITVVVGIIFGGIKTIGWLFTPDNDKAPSYYDTGDPKDMTNKDMEDFIKWKIKDNKRQKDNAPFGE